MRLRLRHRPIAPPRRFRLPPRTIRLRLTMLYAGLFLACGVGLLAVTYVLVRDATGGVLVGTAPNGRTFSISKGKQPGAAPAHGATPALNDSSNGRRGRVDDSQAQAQALRDQALAERQHAAVLHELLKQSGIALALMTAASILLGWLAAGRVLRPLRTINERAREISATSLHKRLALAGPDDEVTRLASTFDDLLGRLEASFTAQRQFVANASHELRTPLARARTLAEVAVSDPEASVDSLRASHKRVLAAGEQQERLIEALLTLARSERGLDEHEPFDLAAVSATMLHARQHEAKRRGVSVHANLEPAVTSGDPRLAERLVANLIDNALRHNRPGGRVDVATTTRSGQAILSVANTGPLVPPDEVERLFRPFERLGANRTDHSDGIGLGLSIVAAIATAHAATLTTRAQPAGGLDIEAAFPSAAGAADHPAPPEARREPAPARAPALPARAEVAEGGGT
jgi:signal transduction histidine kinase